MREPDHNPESLATPLVFCAGAHFLHISLSDLDSSVLDALVLQLNFRVLRFFPSIRGQKEACLLEWLLVSAFWKVAGGVSLLALICFVTCSLCLYTAPLLFSLYV